MVLSRYILTWTLATAVAVAPSLSLASESGAKVTPAIAIQIASPEQARAMDIKRYLSSAELSRKAAGVLATGGRTISTVVFHDALQTSIIMFAASAAQLAKSRMERDGLLNGYQPKVEDVQKATLTAAEDVICGGESQRNPTVGSEIACSGEFWMGVGGAIVGRAAVQVAVVQALKVLLKANPTRAALINLVGSFASSFLMLGGFAMSAQLWTQGVHLLNDPVKEQQAHGLFGRASAMYISGHWSDYVKTPDGQIAAAVFGNMYNILVTSPDQRSAWFYNGWRFGMARGEMVVNLTILMSAMSAGGVVGASLASTLGLPEVVVTFLIATAFGFGISYAQVYFPDLEVGSRLTDSIQSTRAFLAQHQHNLAQYQLDIISQTYDTHRTWNAGNMKYKKIWEKRMARWLPSLREYRQNEAGIMLEKYNDLKKKVDEAEGLMNVAKDVIEHSDLRNAITLNENGEYLSVKDAQEKYCQKVFPGGTGYQDCNFPLSTQLKRIEKSKAILADGRSVLVELGKTIVEAYIADSKLLQGYLDNVSLQFPDDLAAQLAKEIEIVSTSKELYRLYFASLHEPIRQQLGVEFPKGEVQQKLVAMSANAYIDNSYLNGVNDQSVLEQISAMLNVAPETSPQQQ